jgi:predicted phosphodiesterase
VSGDIWGLISDVHGNLAALDRAIELLRSAGANRLAFLGDYLGRGDSDACVARIREVADVAIVGNRDLEWQLRVAPITRDWVLTLPRTAVLGSLLLAHGDARLTPRLSTSEIGREFLRAWPEMEREQAQVFAFGHSHFARIWRKRSATAAAERMHETRVPIDDPYRYFLNVGTTGLPFPGKGGPSVAIVDFDARELRQVAL